MNFTFQYSMIILLVCLIGISFQFKLSNKAVTDDRFSQQEPEIQLNSDEYNKMVLIKSILKAYDEMKSLSGLDSESSELTRTVKRSNNNDKLKELLIKRAMKNVALGFGKK